MPKEETISTLCLKSYKDFHYLNTDEILYLKADNNTTDFIMKDGRTISAFKTLKSFEDKLPKNFIRVHQSYILNINYVSRINYGKAICSLKSGKTQLPFSKSYKENIDSLKKILSKNTISTLN
jgi:DNA-binding LytR/AlgR family response regulator